jgi:hypothetical protein
MSGIDGAVSLKLLRRVQFHNNNATSAAMPIIKQ